MTDGNSLDKLSDGQRACLRLVYAHMSSKEIAAELGISPHTVDQRLRAAMRILDCDSRIAAARLLATHENPAYQRLIYQSPDIVPPAVSLPTQSTVPGMQEETATGGLGFRERQAAFTIDDVPAVTRFPMPFPQEGRQRNDLTVLQKIGWIIAVAILSPVAFSAIISSLEIWSRLSRH